MSNKVIKGKVVCGEKGCMIKPDGIHHGTELTTELSISRLTLFINERYVGLFDLPIGGAFYFSHINIKYEYFVGSKTLKMIFNGADL